METRQPYVYGSLIYLAVAIFFSVGSDYALDAVALALHLDLYQVADMLKVQPLALPVRFFSSLLTILCSAGLFSMALHELRGTPPHLSQFWDPAKQWRRFLMPALAIALSSLALQIVGLTLSPKDEIALFYVGIEFAMAPLYVFVVPGMVARDLEFKDALAANIAMAPFRYFELLWLAIRAFFTSVWGVLLCGVGLIFTIPIYQREVMRAYLVINGEMLPVEPESSEVIDPDAPPAPEHTRL